MNISLPKSFSYVADSRNRAYIRGDTLVIIGNINFDSLMYELTYATYEDDVCFYCGEKVTRKTRSLDHMYPKVWGGVSIPDNLVLSCNKCNSEKNCLTTWQYLRWSRKRRSKKDKEEVYQNMVANNAAKYHNEIILPSEWMIDYPTAYFEDVDLPFGKFHNKTQEKLSKFYEEHGHYPKPMIVTSNDFILQGKDILFHARLHDIDLVPVIILENVIRKQ